MKLRISRAAIRKWVTRVRILRDIAVCVRKPARTIRSAILGRPGQAEFRNGLRVTFGPHDGKLHAALLSTDPRWRQWTVTVVDNDFLFQIGDLKFFQPNKGALTADMNSGFGPLFGGFDYEQAVVLDVGAYFGETVVLAHSWGARRFIAYEPLPRNVCYLKSTLDLNGINAVVVPCAVGEVDGSVDWFVDARTIGNLAFGLESGATRVRVETRSWESILTDAADRGATIAKVNCEGGERHLIQTPDTLISQVPNWAIEAHSPTIAEELCKKFRSMDYRVDKVWTDGRQLTIIQCRRL